MKYLLPLLLSVFGIHADAQILQFDTGSFFWSTNGLKPFGVGASTSTPRVWGIENLQQGLGSIALAKSGSSTAIIALIGDSWTYQGRYGRQVCTVAHSKGGDGGAGWISWADTGSGTAGSPDSTVTAVTNSAAWKLASFVPSPDCAGVISTNATGTPLLHAMITGGADKVKVHSATVSGGGNYYVSFDGGSTWSGAQSTDGSAAYTVTEFTPPGGSLNFQIKQDDAGTAGTTIYGIDVQKTSAPAIRVHNLHHSGSRAQNWIGVDATMWESSIAALDPDIVTILLGTNDQALRTPAEFAQDMTTLVNRIKTAVPAASVVIVMPCENGLGRAVTMQSLADAAFPVARSIGTGWVNLQYYYGLAGYSSYGYGSTLNYFASDNVHPTWSGTSKGHGPLVQAFVETLTLQ